MRQVYGQKSRDHSEDVDGQGGRHIEETQDGRRHVGGLLAVLHPSRRAQQHSVRRRCHNCQSTKLCSCTLRTSPRCASSHNVHYALESYSGIPAPPCEYSPIQRGSQVAKSAVLRRHRIDDMARVRLPVHATLVEVHADMSVEAWEISSTAGGERHWDLKLFH